MILLEVILSARKQKAELQWSLCITCLINSALMTGLAAFTSVAFTAPGAIGARP